VGAIEETVTITNKVGLHARPATLFVQTAARFSASVRARSGSREADAKRILEVLQLGAAQGATLTISADGADASEAVSALVGLVKHNFGEEE
jgi:phosphotransferase system HPr (HPr) family protein